jgi:hypothetical protein
MLGVGDALEKILGLVDGELEGKLTGEAVCDWWKVAPSARLISREPLELTPVLAPRQIGLEDASAEQPPTNIPSREAVPFFTLRLAPSRAD